MSDETELTAFENKTVIRTAIEIPSAAGGLRDALRVAPIEIEHGQRTCVVLDGPVVKVRYDEAPAKEVEDRGLPTGDGQIYLVRVHVLGTDGAAIIDRDLVAPVLDETKRRVAERKAEDQRRREQDAGIMNLVDDTGKEGLCAFPGCPYDDGHDGDHGYDPDSGVAPPAGTAPVEDALKAHKKDVLRALCDERGIIYGSSATGSQLVAKLKDLPGILAAADGAEAALRPPAPDNVTELHPEASSG